MSSRITVSDKEYLKNRASEEFNPLLRRLKDLLIPVKEKIRAEVRKSMGVDKVEVRMDKLQAQLDDLKRQHKAIVGDSFGNREPENTPFAREVDIRLMRRPEAKTLQALQTVFKKTKDEIAMAGVPGELRKLLSGLPKALEPFQEKVKRLESMN